MITDTFRDQVVIITGASSGIGRALALRLGGIGARLGLAARDRQRLEEVAEACRAAGGKALILPTDVSDEGQCQALIEGTVHEFGRIDMLINNAGISVIGLLEELPDLALFKRVMEVNFYGNVHCTYHALPYLKHTGGRIVCVSSLGGKLPLPYNTPYIASKHALHGFYDALRMELATSGVSVTLVCPYWVVTEFHERLMDKHGTPRGTAGRVIYTEKMMTADGCAQRVLQAAARRKREVLMGAGLPGMWLKLLAPGLLDRLVIKFVLEPIVRRTRASRGRADGS